METASQADENSWKLSHHTFSNDSTQDYDAGNGEQSGVLSDEFMGYSTRIIYVAICGTLSSFGIVFNIVNIVVFIKQGFADSVNISLCALAMADLSTLCCTFIQSLCYNIWINQLVIHINFRHVQYIAGAWPRGFFVRISSFITAYISFERCLCVILPLRVKVVLTRRVTLTVIAFIYVTILSGMFVIYSSLELKPWFNDDFNKTVTSLVYINGEVSRQMERDYLLVLSLYQVTAFILVSVFTVTLIVKMKSKNKWRQKTLTSNQMESMSTRDRKVMKMVLLISLTFVICYIPSTSQLAAMYSVSNYGVKSVYKNMYIFVWSVCTMCEIVCATVNILFYYSMSSKYAAALDGMMPGALKSVLGKKQEVGKKQETG